MKDSRTTYIVAVSGGVDSVVLLDQLVNNRLEVPYDQLIVAHFDHGIRDDSGVDAMFVEKLAKKYGLKCEVGHAQLGSETSEEQARNTRYTFLRQVCKNYNASGIILAHHQDDMVETAIINLLRGTSWRGLASMTESSYNDTESTLIIRPLLDQTKVQLIQYAHDYALRWREDSTNDNQKYLRNYVRLSLLPSFLKKDPEYKTKILRIITHIQNIRDEVEAELTALLPAKSRVPFSAYQINRYRLTMWPEVVACEVIYTILTSLDPNWHPSQHQTERALLFAKTARSGKQLQITKHLLVSVKKHLVSFQFNP